MATSDSHPEFGVYVPNVTLAVAKESVPTYAGVYSSILEAVYLGLHPDYKTWGAGPRSGVTTWYYVSATASGGGDGSKASPWTLAEGIAAPLQPGQGLRLKAGTYDRAGAPIEPTWSGTAGSPIYIEADDINNPPVIDFGRTTVSTAVGPVEVSGGGIQFQHTNSYVGIYGLELIGSAFGYAQSLGADHITFERCHVHGATGEEQNNISAFSFHDVTKSVIRNNLVTDVTVVDTVNSDTYLLKTGQGSAFLTYRGENILFEHNEIDGVGKGFYIKAPSDNFKNGNIIRRNKFVDCNDAFFELYGNSEAPKTHDRNIAAENLIVRCDGGLYDRALANSPQPKDLYVVNNTWINCRWSANGHSGYRVWNNIIDSPPTSAIIIRPGVNPDIGPTALVRAYTEIVKVDYNCYPQDVAYYIQDIETTFGNLDNWKTATNTSVALNIPAPGPDPNSFVADPLYLNKAGDDYRLATGSPCIGAGEGGDNIGAYATQDSVIGRIT